MMAIITALGFRQNLGSGAGLSWTYKTLARPYNTRRDIEVFPPVTWDGNVKGMAAQCEELGVKQVVIIAYSHGVGSFAYKLEKELARYGIQVALLLSCDGVFRPGWLVRMNIAQVFSFRSLLPWSKIKLSANVKQLVGIRQNNKLPKGHPFKWAGRVIRPSCVPFVTHRTIDESATWKDLVQSELQNLLGSPENS